MTVHSAVTPHRSIRSPEQAADGADGGGGGAVAETLLDEAVANLPGKDTWILLAVVFDALLDVRGGHTGLAAADDARADGARFLKRNK